MNTEHDDMPPEVLDRMRARLREVMARPATDSFGVTRCTTCGGVIPLPPSKVKRVALGPTCRCDVGGDAA